MTIKQHFALSVFLGANLLVGSLAAGGLTEAIAPADLVFEEVDGLVAVEAEHFLSQEKTAARAWYRVEEGTLPAIKPDPDGPHLLAASGASYLEALPDTRVTHDDKLIIGENIFLDPGLAGVLTYPVHFNTPGRYYVWVRHFSTGAEDNGLHVGLNGEWPESGRRWQTIIKREWAWESRQRTDTMHRGERFKLYLDIPNAGVHRIHFSMREDGFEFDKFVLAMDREYVPEGFGPDSRVKSGEMPSLKVLSPSYTEAPELEPENLKIRDISKGGPAYQASVELASQLRLTEPVVAADLVFAEVDGVLAIEAEHFATQSNRDIRAWFRIEEASLFQAEPDIDGPHLSGSSGASYVEALPDSRWSSSQPLVYGENFFIEPIGVGLLTYRAHFANPGRYYVWIRHFSTGSEDNGIHVGLNGDWPESGKRWQTTLKRQWAWDCRQRTEENHAGVPMAIYLDIPSPGVHEIQFCLREDGMEFDKFVLASDINYRPEGFGPESVVKSGQAPAPRALSQGYKDDGIGEQELLGPAVPLPEGTVRLKALAFNFQDSDFYADVDQGAWLAINPNNHKQATASAVTPVGNASYTVIFHAVGENDGSSRFRVRLGGKELGSFECPMSLDTFEIGTKFTTVFRKVYINEGELFEVTGTVASADGIEYSRARWLGLTLLPESATEEQIASARRGLGDLSGKADAVNLKVSGELKQWHKVTIDFEGPEVSELDDDVNPFLDYRYDLRVTHSSGSPSYVIPGYFAADGHAAQTSARSGRIWRAHFSPDTTGDWTYVTSFYQGPGVAIGDNAGVPVEQFDGIEGRFTVAPSDKTGRDFRAHGRLQYVGKSYLQFAGSGQHFLKAGPDAPETLLAYVDFDNTETRLPRKGPLKTWEPHLRDWSAGDPNWKDGQGKALIGALNYLADKGLNAFSFLTYNAGGDGDNVWPYVDRDDKRRFDVSKLAQWAIVFEHAQSKGLYLHFKLQENESDDNREGAAKKPKFIPEAMDGGATGPERKLYLREMVARFGYNLALNWNLGEENTQTYAEQTAMANYLREIDPYDHLIVIHTFPAQQDPVYNQLIGDQSIVRGASTQNKWDAAHHFTLRWVNRSKATGVPWIVANDEQNPAAVGVPPDPGYVGYEGMVGERFERFEPYDLNDIRKCTLWGTLMAGGAGVEYYFGYWVPETDLAAQDWRSRDRSWDYCRIALEFFHNNAIPFWEMENADALVGNPDNLNTTYCLAKAGEVYVVYLTQGGEATLDLNGVAGEFEVKWYNPRQGGALMDSKVTSVRGGKAVDLGPAPADQAEDWAILLRRR